MIEVHDVHKSFGYRPVLRGVSLVVGDGETVALIGANGAGKSTLLHILSTLIQPDYGEVRIAGFDLARKPQEIRRRIGLIAHKTLLYDDLSVGQNLRFYGRMYGVPKPEVINRSLMERLGLWERRDELVRSLSRGFQQRAAIARALVHDPPILLLDEPDTGLDAHTIEILRALVLNDGARRRAVLMATHNVHRAAKWGRRVAVLADGRVTVGDSTDVCGSGDQERLFETGDVHGAG